MLVIEDASHALGSRYKDSKGKWHRCGDCIHTDMAIFSFHPVKPITTGEGGMVVTNNKKLYERLRLFRTHGITRDSKKMHENHGSWYYEMQELGFNYRITDFQCALGIKQLRHLGQFIKRRREIVAKYNKSFANIPDLIIPQELPDVQSACHIYVLQFDEAKIRKSKKQIFDALRQAGINVNVHYIPIYFHPFYKNKFGDLRGECPVAEKYYRQAITLPLYPDLSRLQVQYVIEQVLAAIKR